MTPDDLSPAGSGYVELWRKLYHKTLEQGTYTTEYRVLSAPDIVQLNMNALKEGQSVVCHLHFWGNHHRTEESGRSYRTK